MQTIFDPATRESTLNRISMLHENSKPLWGKMTVYQMVRHCTLADEMYLGGKQYRRSLLGKLIGNMALKGVLKDDAPLRRNAPAPPQFLVPQTYGDLNTAKAQWIALIRKYEHYPAQGIRHWFFGDMNREQVGQFAFKHADHHLRQFGC